MEKQKKNQKNEEITYWQSMADGMVGLLLCILLILLLLILYLVRIADSDYVDKDPGDHYEQYDNAGTGTGDDGTGLVDDEEGNSWSQGRGRNGSGGGEQGGPGTNDNLDHPYDDPDPGAGDGNGTDKAAVFVQMVDKETGRTIKKQGVEFELYGHNSALQVLSTYYPKKIDYQKYETDENGVFYLPEKIALGSYYLHCLSQIEGYDVGENTGFTVDKAYDWDDPYVVTVSLDPSKNVIQIQVKDAANGDAVSEAVFDVVADGDIVTEDGTTRYQNGDTVDTLITDAEGKAESKELYLGSYLLRQTEAPQYYARNKSDTSVEVQSRNDAGTGEMAVISEEMTSIAVVLKDALYDTTYLEGAEFAVSTDDGQIVETYQTDKQGKFTVSKLQKNTRYHIRQTQAVSAYQKDYGDYTFTVNSEGLIDGESRADLNLTNRIVRISVGVRDKIFRGQVSDINLALYDQDKNVVKTWNTTGLETTIEGLAAGEYMVVINGKEERTITVEDVTEMQKFEFDRWTTADIGALFGAGIFAVFLLTLTVFLIRKKKREKAEREDQ